MRNLLECELQQFGHLIVIDKSFKIVGISEQALSATHSPLAEVLNSDFALHFESIFENDKEQFFDILQDLRNKNIPRQILSKKIFNKDYYVKFSEKDDFLYIDWERKIEKSLSASTLNEFGFLFDPSYPHNWNYICKSILNLLDYQHVFVLQIQESGHSKVLAESNSSGEPIYHKKELSKDFLTADIVEYYKSLSYRYSPNIRQKNQKFYSIDSSITTFQSQLLPLPRTHHLYLNKLKLGSALFFTLFLDGKFWGLMVAHSHKKKKVDLQKRKLCSIIIQSSMTKYENLVKQDLINFNKQIHETENLLKERLSEGKTVNCAMVNSMDTLLEMTKSDGVAIYNQGDLFFSGHCPKSDQFYEIIQYLQQINHKSIFKDYNFNLNRSHHFSKKLPFAGLLAFTIGQDKDYYIVWFRKESLTSVVQMEILDDKSETNQITENKIRIWEKPIRKSAEPWGELDMYFIESLERSINESIVNKNKERDLLTEELKAKNNELEMFTFGLSHDLKNPLSILKMGLKFLENTSHKMPEDKIRQWYKNLGESVQNMEEIINNMVTICQSKTITLTKDPVPMAYTLHKIAQDLSLIYQAPHCKIHYGKLYPLWGEKSALYQVFLNLIGNAIKYSSNKKQPNIHIKSEIQGAEVYYSIKDNGIGISESILPTICDMFTRSPNAQKFQGSGIGLSLVKRIMERLGGTITIKSKENVGTEIILTFPMVSEFPSSMLP